MLRLLGFVTGSALVVVPTLWLLQGPEAPSGAVPPPPQTRFTTPEDDPVEPAPAPATAVVNPVPDEPAPASPGPAPDVATAATAPADPPPPAAEGDDTAAPTAPLPPPGPAGDAPPDIASAATGPAPDTDDTGSGPAASGDGPVPPATGGTHLFWSPFRSEAAARGFARRLTRVSGVPIRVAGSAPGNYQVGFDYLDELERNWYLGQIQARSGLDLGVPAINTETRDHDSHRPDPGVAAGGPADGAAGPY